MTTAAAPDTRSRILDAALDLFSEHGFEGTTLQQVADRLGLTKAALYYHFRSKDDLLSALRAPAVKDCDSLLDAYELMPETPARRRKFVEAYLDFLMRHRRWIAYIFRDLTTLAHPAIRAGTDERRARMEALLAGADRDDFGAQIRAAMVFAGMHGVVVQYRAADTEQLRAAMLDTVGMLLRPRRRAAVRTRTQAESTRRPYAPS